MARQAVAGWDVAGVCPLTWPFGTGAGGGLDSARVITSLDNPRVKEVVRLRSVRERRRAGLFVVEGRREVERARAAGLNVVATYFAPALLAWPEGEEVSARVLAKMAYRAEPEGVLAVVEAPAREVPRGGSLYVVSVGLEKPGNLGAIARSADAAGADALLVAEGLADVWNPNAIRASTGAVFALPVVEVSLDDVAGLGVQVVAAVVGASTPHFAADLRPPTALLVGAEDEGLDSRWREAADVELSIPTAGRAVDSLNAATAAAILLFEAVRQRARAE
jgi:TrmH family RNA methyltransferase